MCRCILSVSLCTWFMVMFDWYVLLFVSVTVHFPAKSPGCGPVCLIHCEYGNVLDASGCSTCACREKPVEV